ncbi:NAD(P)H-dependent FMN reductase [Ktedonobacteria bacterium brp13]|nr:NAD(P)H-dependent FMN reductase [Ktedonobacteria bacterium brp13]
MNNELKILGIAGSLRKGSFNKAALRSAISLTPSNVTLETFDISSFPLFNQDDDNNPPEVIRQFKGKIRASDAILFATPEYNYSVPGVLKNAIDWASRPYGDNAWEGKPVAIMSASIGMLGGTRAQHHLRQTFVFLNVYPLNSPEVIIPNAADKFDSAGNLTDQHTKEKIQELLKTLSVWAVQWREIKQGMEM